jgi:hypothetical protein
MEVKMSPRTVFMARLIGLFLVAMAAAMVVNKPFVLQTITAIVHEPQLLLTFGMIVLPVGLAMVIGHNVWSGGPAPVVVTLVGWAILIKGMVLLFLSPAALLNLYEMVRFGDFYYGYAVAIVLIGLYLVYAGFRLPPSAIHREPTHGAGDPAN